jgi:hypothetical protein
MNMNMNMNRSKNSACLSVHDFDGASRRKSGKHSAVTPTAETLSSLSKACCPTIKSDASTVVESNNNSGMTVTPSRQAMWTSSSTNSPAPTTVTGRIQPRISKCRTVQSTIAASCRSLRTTDPTSGQAVKYQYDADSEMLIIRLKTPDTPLSETRGDWSWTEHERDGYEAFHERLSYGDLSTPEFKPSRRKTGDAY